MQTAIKRALISVSDKSGAVEFARGLVSLGVEILSTGSTCRLLREHGVAVREVSDYTGFPEILDGRVKTLHPKIHGGLLGRRDVPTHLETMKTHGIAPIDLLAVNLYPFAQTVAQPGCSLETALENIDIGGPTMLRAAAKNYAAVTVIVDSADYAPVLAEMRARAGTVDAPLRFALACKAFEHTARYDAAIANYLGALDANGQPGVFPRTFNLQLSKRQDLRYGENPHQKAALYLETAMAAGAAHARQLQGKELSFNNIADADAAWECVQAFDQPACVIVKHANPCGVAVAADLLKAYDRAYVTDPTSAFGGVIAFNRTLDAATARAVTARQFVEVVAAPQIETAAAQALAEKPNVRVLVCAPAAGADELDYKRVQGGMLIQERDRAVVRRSDLKVVSRRQPTQAEWDDLLFVWRVVKFVKSNAIVYGKHGSTLGIGAGQMSRVDSARIAALKAADAGLDLRGAVLASDAFFPFRDGLDSAGKAGVTAVIQPGGSMRDQEVIAAADEYNIAMVFTGIRHFKH